MTPKYWKPISREADFREVVRLGETQEGVLVDFKAKIDEGKRDARLEVCRDVAQFANTDGGWLLVGVSEKMDGSGVKVAHDLIGVNEPTKTKDWIEQAMDNHLVPGSIGQTVDIVAVDGTQVVVVNVPASRLLAAVWDRQKGTIQYPRRSSTGKVYMTPDDVERHIMNGSRAARIALKSAKEQSMNEEVTVSGGFWRRNGNILGQAVPQGVFLESLDSDCFCLRILTGGPDRKLPIPYGVVREAWCADRRVHLLLDVLIIQADDGEWRLEPR